MAADGAYRWQGMASAPDPQRVAAIDAAWRDADPAVFAEPARAATLDRLDQALSACRTGDLAEAGAQLTQARSVLEGLRPEALEPRRGLAGLFDSRGDRLKRFRVAFDRAADALVEAARGLGGRVQTARQRSDILDARWTDIRDAVIDLDAHLQVAARRLSGHAGETPHPFETRRAGLDACRAAAQQALPLIRGVQGADARSAAALEACITGITACREDWTKALGLGGRRPKRVRPDPVQLARLRDDAMARIDWALAEVTASHAHRAGLESRLAALRTP